MNNGIYYFDGSERSEGCVLYLLWNLPNLSGAGVGFGVNFISCLL